MDDDAGPPAQTGTTFSSAGFYDAFLERAARRRDANATWSPWSQSPDRFEFVSDDVQHEAAPGQPGTAT